MHLKRQRRANLKRRVGTVRRLIWCWNCRKIWMKRKLPSRKKKPTIVDNTRKKGESRKRSRKTFLSFMDTVGEEVEDEIQAKIARFDSRSLSKYKQLSEKILLKRRKWRMRY